jgi:hypothetical protein
MTRAASASGRIALARAWPDRGGQECRIEAEARAQGRRTRLSTWTTWRRPRARDRLRRRSRFRRRAALPTRAHAHRPEESSPASERRRSLLTQNGSPRRVRGAAAAAREAHAIARELGMAAPARAAGVTALSGLSRRPGVPSRRGCTTTSRCQSARGRGPRQALGRSRSRDDEGEGASGPKTGAPSRPPGMRAATARGGSPRVSQATAMPGRPPGVSASTDSIRSPSAGLSI